MRDLDHKMDNFKAAGGEVVVIGSDGKDRAEQVKANGRLKISLMAMAHN